MYAFEAVTNQEACHHGSRVCTSVQYKPRTQLPDDAQQRCLFAVGAVSLPYRFRTQVLRMRYLDSGGPRSRVVGWFGLSSVEESGPVF